MDIEEEIKELADLTDSQRVEAVSAFNAVFGEMDRVLWCLSMNCRGSLLEGRSSSVVEALVWTVKSWWGVQGVSSETKTIMAQALATLDWSADLFEETSRVPGGADSYACDRVSTLVTQSMSLGVSRREFSLGSKVLHWLLPWRIPVYDSFVRGSLSIPKAWDHPAAYREIARELFGVWRELETTDFAWLGPITPRSPLRGFDKCLWWLGGGSKGRAKVVRDPWRVVYELGLKPS